MKTKPESALEIEYSQDIEFGYKQRKEKEAKSKSISGRKICQISVIFVVISVTLGVAIWKVGFIGYFENEKRMG